MKNILKILLAVCLSTPLWAQFEGYKIMINPGHGGHDSNDRYISTTGFWESEGNLTKGLHLRDLLEARGAEIVMSRTQNRTEDDLPLSQIVAIANSNDVDYMHSIHSNAFNANTNYVLMLYQGFTNDPTFPDARAMGLIMGPKLDETNYTTGSNYAGDFTFYGTGQAYLGVFRGLSMPGTLSEGSFHDYRQESWRLMNLDYRRHEAVAMLRSFLQHYDLPPLSYGAVAGLARDKTKQVSYGYNSSLPNDRYVPINNIKVSLYQDSIFLKSYNGDFNNNGYFVFDSVDPGSYTLIFDYGKFKSDTIQTTIAANKTTFEEVFPDPVTDKAPEIFGTSPVAAAGDVNTYSDLKFIFSQSMNAASTQSAISIMPEIEGTFSWKENNTLLSFRPAVAFTPNTVYQVTIDTSAQNTLAVHLSEPFVFEFTTADDHIYPAIVETNPAAGDSIATDKSMTFVFDQSMLTDSVQAAFQIFPQTGGEFSWAENNTELTFNPDSLLHADTEYTVSFSVHALNSYSVGLSESFELTFKTRKRNNMHVVESYPAEGDSGISTIAEYYFEFDALVDGNTVLGNVQMWDETNNQVALKSYKLEERNGHGVLRFETRTEIEKNRTYTVHLLPGMRDIEALPLPDTVMVSFHTTKKTYTNGTILDDFNSESGWQDPNSGSASEGINDASSFSLSALKKISGVTSGKLVYTFTGDSGGICQVNRFDAYMFSAGGNSMFGIWVYGDYSFNVLELWFEANGQPNKAVVLDTLNFSGWKLLQVPVSDIGTGTISLHSLVIRQQKDAYPEGTLYLEDIQYGIVTGLKDSEPRLLADKFQLQQNYPNPFNPTTVISYQLPVISQVKLSIYNVLGQKVVTLVDKNQTAGSYKVEWDATNFASGVYWYKIETDAGFKQSRKLLLLK